MSFYELDRPVPVPAKRAGTYLARIRAFWSGMIDSIAYARMMRVMHEMDDATLAKIGVARADIPAYVNRCLGRS